MNKPESTLDLQNAILMRRLQKRLQVQADTVAPAIPRADRSQPLPLSSAQQRLWFVDRLDASAGAAYHMPAGLRLSGRLDKNALQRALDRIVARHEVLRTRFIEHEGAPAQVVDDAVAAFVLDEIDLGSVPVEQHAATIERLAEAEAARPFDLARGPLIRGQLIFLGESEHVLLLTQHHIVSDGWSVGVLVRELSQLYAAFSQGQSDPLPALPIQYADYASWQRAQAGGASTHADIDFWKRALGGAPDLLAMPTDRPRPAQQSFRGDTVELHLPKALSADLRTLSKQHDSTLFMTLLAGWSLLLSRFSGQNDVVIGTPVANRERTELEPLIGFFVNTLALRVSVDDDPTVAELLQRVRATTLAAYEHQALPFDVIVDALQPARSMSHAPIFQAMLSLDNTPGSGELTLPGLRISTIEQRYATAQFDMTLSLVDRGECISGTLRYATDLFDRDSMQRLLQAYEVLLSALTRQSDRRVSELPLLDDEQQRDLLQQFSPGPRSFDDAQFDGMDFMHRRFEAHAAARPDATALTFDGASLSYGELNRRANHVAHRLLALGVQPDDRVALCVERSFELVVGALAILKAGAGYVPLDPRYPTDRLRFALGDCAPVALLTQSALREQLPEPHCPVVLLDEAFDGMADHDPELPQLAPQHLAYVIYTSGSTGKPKGVMVEHRNVARLFTATDGWFAFDDSDVWSLFHSFAFDFSVWELWGALAYGGRLVVVPFEVSRSPQDFHALLCREGITVLNQTPSAFRQLIAAQGDAPVAHRLRYVIFGGEALDPTLLRPWLDRAINGATRLINMYGITETTVHVTYREIRAADAECAGRSPIGVPIPDLQLYLLDRHGRPVPLGVAGELYVGGAGVARGYLNRPELSAERFIANPFASDAASRLYRTGDLARRLADGSIDYIGRIDFQVKIRGFRIELGEIEARLGAHPSVRDAVVIAREDQPGDKRLVAYVTLAEGVPEAPPAEALRSHLLLQLPDYMAPAAYIVLDALPLTSNGKLDRKALPAPGGEAFARSVYRAPTSDCEKLLCRVWADVLGLERVGVDDNYFDIGGDSIRSIAVVAKAKAEGLELAVVDLFRAPTVAGLSAALASRHDAPAMQAALPLLRDDDRARLPDGIEDAYPVTLLQQGMIFHNAVDHDSGLYHDVSSNCLDLPEWRPDVMQEVLHALAAKHPVLRTAIDLRGYSEPLQLVHADARLPMTIIDIAGLDPVAQNETIAEFIDRERRTAFDLASAPLLRVFIHVRGPRTIQFTLSFHHAVLDGWSVASLQTELSAAYAAQLRTGAAPLDALALGPKCAVIAERAALRSDAQRAFWHDYLNDHAYDALPPPDGEVDAGMHCGRALRFDAAHSQRLQALASELGVPLRSLLLAAHLRVMSMFTSSHDVTTGLVCNVRPEEAGGDKVLGLFLNTLPLRQRLVDGSWSELIVATYRNELEVMAHRHYPYFQLQLDNQRRPLFDVIFNFTNFHVYEGLALSATEDASMAFESTGYGLDVDFDFHPQRGILVKLTPGSLSAAQTERLLGYYVAALHAIADDPNADHGRADLLDPIERTQLLVEFNKTAADFPPGQLLQQPFEARASAEPDAIAVVADEGSLTYGELNRRANRLAHHLIALGVRPDARVAICLDRSLDLIVGLLAILKSGGAYVPLDPSYPPDRLAFMLADCKPFALVTTGALRDCLPRGEGVAAVVLDDPGIVAVLEQAPSHDPDPEQLGLTSRNLSYVIYTSGSTGTPKGVMLEHRNVVNLVHGHVALCGMTPRDCVLQFASFSFDNSVVEVFPALSVGARIALRPADVMLPDSAFVGFLEQQQVTVADLPTAFWHLWAQEIRAGRSLPGAPLRLVLVGGEKAELRHLKGWFDTAHLQQTRWINAYGPTEAAVNSAVVCFDRHTPLPAHDIPIGRPVANGQIRILDDRLQLVPLGVSGEIHIGGAGVARGYLNRPELTAEKFIRDPFDTHPDARLYRTGDLGRWLPDGTVEYLGRNDFQVKIRGFRIELGEIEARLCACEGVGEALVIAREDTPGDKRLVAYVVPKDGELSVATLRAELSAALPDHMVPGAFVQLAAFPLTPSNKIDRKALPAPAASAVLARTYQPPEGPVETALAEIWQELLGLERVGRDDQFFELGGHSLLVVRLIEQVRRAGHALDVTQVFAAPTLREMAAAIAGPSGSAECVVVPPNRIPRGCRRLTPDMLALVDLTQPTLDALVATMPGGAGNVQDLYPLGPAQQGILFHHLLQPGSDAYLLRTALAFDTRERMDAFVGALRRVVDRHDILRTTVRWESLEQPVQVVLRDIELPIEHHALSTGGAELAFLDLTDPRQLQMRLDEAPLLRLHVAHNPDNGEWLLALIHHHLVCDHVTMDIMMSELQACMHAPGEPLPDALPYRNFIAQSLATPAAAHETYFRRVLSDVTEPTAPFGVLDVRGDGSDVQEAYVDLSDDLAASLRSSARTLGVTPAALFHVAMACVVAQCSGRDDVVFGTVTSGRLQGSEGSAQVLGMFINTLPLRVALAGRSAPQAVLETHAALSELLAHEQASLAMAQRCSGIAASTPLFTTLFNYRHSQDADPGQHVAGQQDPWRGVRVLANDERTNYPITLSIDDFGTGFGIASQCIRAIDAQRVADYMLVALTGLADALLQPTAATLDALSVLPSNERRQLLAGFNDTDRNYPRDVLLHQLFERQVECTPTAPALRSGDLTLSYAELNAGANRLARHLIEHGAGPEQRIAVCVERSVEMVVALLAVLKAGAAYVPLDPGYPTDRLAYMIQDCEPASVLTHAATDDLIATLGVRCPRIMLDDPAAPWLGKSDADLDGTAYSATQLAYIIYTSGSTGLPKGAMNEHRAVVNRLLWMQEAYCLDAHDRVLQKTPFSFDVSVWEFFWPLISGATLVMARPEGHKDPAYLSELIAAEAITTLHFVPSMLQVFLEHGDTTRCQHLRRVICSGEALPPAAVERFHAQFACTELHNLYGPTEAAVDVTAWHCRPQNSAIVPIGHPIANTRVYILDAQLRPVPHGVAGELYLGGVQIGRGYFNRPQLTAERFLPDPFAADAGARMYRTGDLGRHLPDGAIEYLGRNDFQVKLRGLRIELGEIEARLASHPALHEVVVVAREDKPGSMQLIAYFTTRSGATPPGIDSLREHLVQMLPEYMVPAACVALDALPLSSNGKLDRRALPAPDSGAFAQAEYQAPRDDTERLLCGLWSEVLGVEDVGIHDNFFDRGGDSIRSISIVGKGKSLGLDLAIVDLFQHPTIAALAQLLRGRGAPATPVAQSRYELSAEDRALLPAGVEDAYPISLLQMGMVFHNEYAQGTGVYHDVFSSCVAVSRWRPDALQAALAALSRRHPVLRTAFDLRTYSEPLQLVHADARIPLQVFDVSALPMAEQDQDVADFVDFERTTRFELDAAPLLRIFVHVRGPQSIQFTLSFHHAILDGWSVAALQTELFNHYAACLSDDLPALSTAPLQCSPRSVVEQERQALQSEDARTFWRDYLVDHQYCALPPPDVDADPQADRTSSLHISDALAQGLQDLATRLGVPLRSVLLTAHLRAVAMLSGKTDVVSGLVCNVRPEETDGDKVLGLFLNTLPLRLHLQPCSWTELIRATYRSELQVLQHRNYPYFQLHLDNGRTPYFEIVFNYTNFHIYEGLDHAPDAPQFRAAFESTGYGLGVNFSFDPISGLVLEIDPATLSAAQAERIRDYYAAVLTAMVEQPEASHHAQHFLPAQELQQLLEQFNPAPGPRPARQLIQQMFEDQVALHPDAVALACSGRSVSYAELNRQANQLAHRLIELGVRPDDRVAIAFDRGMAMIVAVLGTLKAGAAYVPLDPAYPSERLAYMLGDSDPAVLLTQGSITDVLPATGVPTVVLDAPETQAALAGQPQHDPDPQALGLRPQHLAYVIYTSGSTGQPKGVMNHHEGLCNLATAQIAEFAVDAGSRVLQFVSMSFDVCISEITMALCSGASLHLADATELLPGAPLLDTLREQRISHVSLPMAVLAALPDDADLPDLRVLIVGGDVLPPALAAHWGARCTLFNSYGPTETTVCASNFRYDGETTTNVPIGKPISNTRIYLLDAHGQPVPRGVAGEIHIGGRGVARGYLKRPELTDERFLVDPFSTEPGGRMYRTGDLGRWRDDGNLEFLGRNDFQVKIRGFRIELGEIESRLQKAPGVREACVLAQEDAPGEKRLIAYVIAQPETTPSTSDLRAWLQAGLAEHMVPSAFVLLDAFPLTPNGKLDRKALPVPDRARSEVEYVAPRDAVEERLCAAFAEVLRFDRVGIHDHFFELGGNSLLVVKLHSLLGVHFPGQLTVADFFQHTSVARLAEFMRHAPAEQRLPDSVSRAETRKARLADRHQNRARRGTSSIEQ